MYDTIVIGIDQSYTNTGISVSADGKLKDVKSVRLDKCRNNSIKRAILKEHLHKLLGIAVTKAEQVVCLVERARIHGGKTSFINIDAIKAMGALTATIVDVCAMYGVAVFSVDTRCWKAQVVGTSKPQDNRYGVPPEKWPTVNWLCEQGFEEKILIDMSNSRKTKGTFTDELGKWMYNDDAADSAGISMYWWLGDSEKLKEEH